MLNDATAKTALCDGCGRAKPKAEPHLAEQGLIECRLKDRGADVEWSAFKQFASAHSAVEPFVVRGVPGASAAWPFQFHPTAIAHCEGRCEAAAQPCA